MFELRRTLEACVGPADAQRPVRLELYQSLASPTRYRARAFEYEGFRLAPTYPQDESGAPSEVADDTLLSERSWMWLVKCGYEFEVADTDAAVRLILADFERASRGDFRPSVTG